MAGFTLPEDLLRRRLMGDEGMGTPGFNPNAEDPRQMPRIMPDPMRDMTQQAQQQPGLPTQPMQPGGQHPSRLKQMLMDFAYGFGESLKKQSGLETDAEKKAREFKMQMAQQQFGLDQQNTASLMQNRSRDDARADQQLKIMQAEAEANRQQRAEAAWLAHMPKPVDPYEGYTGELRAYMESAGDKSKGLSAYQAAQESKAAKGRSTNASAPVGTLVPLTDADGTVTGFFNNKTGAITKSDTGLRKSGVAAGALDKKAQLDVMLQDVNTLSELAATPEGKASIGPIAGRWSAAKQQWTGGEPPTAVHLHQIAKNLSDQLLRARSGAAISPGEYTRMLALVPDPRTPLDTFMNRLNGFQSEMKRLQNTRYANDSDGTVTRKKYNPATGRIE